MPKISKLKISTLKISKINKYVLKFQNQKHTTPRKKIAKYN